MRHVSPKRPAFRPVRNYVVEFFNHPASKGDTVFRGTRAQLDRFLAYEAETLIHPAMRSRADECRWYINSLALKDFKEVDAIVYPIESGDSGAFYCISINHGKRTRRFQDA